MHSITKKVLCKSCVKITFFQVLYSACFQCICGIVGLDINNTLESQYNIR